MAHLKPAPLLLVACATAGLVALVLWPAGGRRGDAVDAPAESSRDRMHGTTKKYEPSVSRDPTPEPALQPGEPSQAAAGVAPARPTTRREELLQLLAAGEAGAPLDRGQLGNIVSAAATELSDVDRSEVLDQVGQHVARRELAWGAELASKLGNFRDRHNFIKALVETAVADDPAQVAAWAAELSDPPLRDTACTTIAMEWARKDLSAALAWAQELPGASRAVAFEGLAWTWAQRDPKAVYEWAIGITEADVRSQVLVKIAKMIAVQDPQHALGWVLQFPEGPGREQALSYAVFQWASRDLAAATAWAAGVPDPGLRSDSEVTIARSWSVQEAEGATTWAAGIPAPAGRAAALKTTLLKWAEGSPAAAAQWLNERGPTEANAEIFRSVTSGLASAQPAVREAWLKSTTVPEWRTAGEQILRAVPGALPGSGASPKG